MHVRSRIKHLAGTVLLAGALVLVGCEEVAGPYEEPAEAAGLSAAAGAYKSQEGTNSLDDAFAAVAEQVPGFGGAFFDEEGTLIVHLTEPDVLEAAVEVLDEVLGGLKARGTSERGRGVSGRTEARLAKYDFRELLAVREQLSEVLGVKGVLSLGIDERTNQVQVGVLDEAAAEAVQAFVSKIDAPEGAVSIQKTEPLVTMASLRDRNAPRRGGLQIAAEGYFCTLGFNITGYAGVRRYLTNSHCTDTAGGVEGTRHYQPTVSGSNIMGYEYADPTGWSCSGRQCRWSDSAIGQYYAGASSDFGGIARPTTWGRWSGPLTINASNPRLRIIRERAFPLGGEMLDKVGRTTGWTYGFVTDTCDDINVFERVGGVLVDTGRTLRCQDQVTGGVMPGDSGSPVFLWRGNDVDLYGILWGGYSDGRKFVFSAMWNIEMDLGGLTTH